MCVKSHWNDSKFFSTRTLLLSHSETPNTRERRNPRHKRNKILHTIVVVVLDAVQLSRFTWDAKCSRFPVANRVLSFKHPPPLFYPSGAFKSTKMHIQSTPTVRPPLKWKRGGLLHNILNILKDLTKKPKTENEVHTSLLTHPAIFPSHPHVDQVECFIYEADIWSVFGGREVRSQQKRFAGQA